MAQRWRSRERRDPDLDDGGGGGSPPAELRRSDDEEEELGNEDLTLEIVARAARRQRKSRRGEPSSDEEVDEDAVVELVEAPEPPRKERKKERRKLKKKQRKEAAEKAAAAAAGEEEKEVGGTQEGQAGTAESVLTEDGVDVSAAGNMVLRKLLRIPRYFDPGETLLATCFNCGEEGHVTANCQMEKRKKPCFVCGLFGHNAKHCTQGQDCFICKKGGHKSKDCPDKYKNNQQSALCLRCGETGHDMFGCFRDYSPDDIKEIKCYVCKQNGHLCCADFLDNYPKELTCYNCAQSGHTGLGCAKQRRETSAVTSPAVCYKCGEEGHFARGCTKSAKSNGPKSELPGHSWKKDRGKDSGTRSAPYGPHKSSKRKSPQFEDKTYTPRHKPKARGGWNGDDDDRYNLPFKKYKSNGWPSPFTPKKQYSNHQFSPGDGDYFTPQPSRRRNYGYSSPSSNYSPSARKHGSSSRFAASNTHIRFSGS